MKNSWLSKRHLKQFKELIVFFEKVFSMEVKYSVNPGWDKLFVTYTNLHICTIYRHSHVWRIHYYSGDRRNYKEADLPEFGCSEFWNQIKFCVHESKECYVNSHKIRTS